MIYPLDKAAAMSYNYSMTDFGKNQVKKSNFYKKFAYIQVLWYNIRKATLKEKDKC